MFNTPTETAKAVQEEFDITVSRQKCEAYDPTKRTGQDLSAELKSEFEATREVFLAAPQNIPISNLSYRQARRQKVLEGAKAPMIILDVLDRAAKDMGGLFTNRQEITGADGEPIKQTIYQLTPQTA